MKRTRRGHLVFCPPEGQVIYTSGTPSDARAWKNVRAQLRRAGLDIPSGVPA
ncbi:hypothetical protein ACMX2H_15940 [Arthrobacter sulfonylureivorans]|uniref:hypothetical protein n=1 Tax=Arthrobacter sulfonylureivorans TaxID=2486855 RepID=UPI0039E61261